MSSRVLETSLSCLLVSLLLAGVALAGDRVWTGGFPEGGILYALAFEPGTDVVYVATASNRAFRSTDAGSTWAFAGAGLPGSVEDLAVATDGRVLALDTLDDLIYRSTDGGVTWTASGTGLEGQEIRRVVADPSLPSTAYVLSNEQLHRSTDGGVTWALADAPVDPSTRYGLAIDPLASSTLYMASGDLWKTTDGGAHWTDLEPDPQSGVVRAVLIDPQSTGTVYAASTNGLWKSTDSGATWGEASDPSDGSLIDLTAASTTPTTIYARINGVTVEGNSQWRSTDGGSSWAPLNLDPLMVKATDIEAEPANPSRVLAATRTGLRASDDGGGTWSRSDNGLAAYFASTLIAHPAQPETLWETSNDGPYKSTDRGASWALTTSGLPTYGVYWDGFAVAPSLPTTLYLGQRDEVYRSTDGGATWSPRIQDPTQFGIFGPELYDLKVAVDDPDHVFLVQASYSFGNPVPPLVLSSTDGGQTWDPLFTPLLGRNEFAFGLGLRVGPTPGRVLATFQHTDADSSLEDWGLLRSTDGGTSWDQPLSGAGNAYPALSIDPQTPDNVYVAVRATGDDSLMRSTDGGSTWADLTPVAPCTRPVTVDPIDSDHLYMGCDIVYESHDRGASWGPFDTGGFPAWISSLWRIAISPSEPDTLHLPTNAGVYNYTIALFADGFESGDTSAWDSTVSGLEEQVAPPGRGARD